MNPPPHDSQATGPQNIRNDGRREEAPPAVRRSGLWRAASFARSGWAERRGVMTTRLNGRRFRVAVGSRAEWRRLRDVSGEGAVIRRLCGTLRPDDTFVDVGANIGLFGLAAAAELSADGRVVAFEPEPRNFSHLVRNFELNGFSNLLQAEQAAVADVRGAVDFAVDGDVGGGTHHLAAGGERATRRVSVDTFDGYCDRTGVAPDVVKVDVEGAEARVVRGMDRLLNERAPRVVLIEIHPGFLAAAGERPEEIRERFAAAGYRCDRDDVREAEEHLWFTRED